LFGATVDAIEIACVYLGDRLGFYRLLHESGPLTSVDLAARAMTDERYTREWLEQQATAGLLTCENPEASAKERRYSLPTGYETVLIEPENMLALTPFIQLAMGAMQPIVELTGAFRTGAGVPYAHYGEDTHEGIARANRPAFTHLLAQEWLPVMADIDTRLRSDPPARIADVGMGQAWSSIALARAYPQARVDGFDLDEASVRSARENVLAAGLENRVAIHLRDAGDPELAGHYDLALAIECIHDMANPVAALSAMRRLVGPGGTALVIDERVPDEFMPHGTLIDRALYGFSVLHCLPVGRVGQPSAETGAVMRRATFRQYAEEAGFSSVEELPIEYDFWRFYRLTA
jgi:2-polyprenyl-3-methyl-5-hydroxy-6-metoxy-1,4-benzoquinol methylase